MRRWKLLSTSNQKHWASLIFVLALSVFTVNSRYSTDLLMTSLTSYKADPFDGTVMPIQTVPDWSNLSGDEYKLSYSEYDDSQLIDIPAYRNDYLTMDPSSLGWSSSDKIIRNTQITYPVPYAGNYELNHCGEGCGSHPAVDIKTAEGTPVYVIANGVVEDAGTSGSWGNYIVVRHEGVPNPASPKQKTTLYSSYSHLLELYVADGDILDKGDVIGQVGDTGTATTYHLHFQIDNNNAPWYPYWPFTTAQASAAGYGFWDAVSNGVGQDNVYAYTVNPMDFVQEYLDEDAVLDEYEEDPEEEYVEDDVSDEPRQEPEQEDPDPSSDLVYFSSLQFDTPYMTQPGENPMISISLLDEDGFVLKDSGFDGDMTLTLSDEKLGKLSETTLTEDDFRNGVAELNFYAGRVGQVTIHAHIGDREYTSSLLYVLDEFKAFDIFGIRHDGTFVPNKAEIIYVEAQDEDGNPTPAFDGYGKVKLSIVQGSGTLEPNILDKDDFEGGVAEVVFTGDANKPTMIQVTYGVIDVRSTVLSPDLFNDFDEEDSYYEAVSYLYRKGTVQGYPDGSFQPLRTVSRVESLKFIFAGLDQTLSPGLKASYKDTDNDQWYSSYLANASQRDIVEGYPDGTFKPSQGVNRVEFLKMLFSTVENISVDPIVKENPYDDVNALAWYAPYVQFAKEKNLFPISGSSFNPAEPMSRVEVAEVIYRLITVLQNGESSYSTSLNRPSDY